MSVNSFCASCGAGGMLVFYELKNVPVHSVLLLTSRQEALDYPKGDIALGFCRSCGFISNLAFDPLVHEYASGYESTQAFSPTFNRFARRLALQMVERYDLRDKDILEIGCGQGEFLTMICELGENRGVGFDPAYVPPEDKIEGADRVTFVADFYSEHYAAYHGDLICCKMTLEHIHQTGAFVSTLRSSIGDRLKTTVFFQVPDVTRILRELAFWDIYYEHCSYFSATSLARLFRRCGFSVIDLWKEYDDQYLMIEARPADAGAGESCIRQEDGHDLAREVTRFSESCGKALDKWRAYFQQVAEDGRRVVIWGAGSKAVAFLTTLNVKDEVEYVVDINPRKHGTYLAGSGQQIVVPAFLLEYEPDVVIVMNPVYLQEIAEDLRRMDLTTHLITVSDG